MTPIRFCRLCVPQSFSGLGKRSNWESNLSNPFYKLSESSFLCYIHIFFPTEFCSYGKKSIFPRKSK